MGKGKLLIEGAKKALKLVGKVLFNLIKPYLGIIGAVLFIIIFIIMMFSDFDDAGQTNASADGMSSALEGESLEQFIRYMHSIEGNEGEKEINGIEYYKVGLVKGNRTVGYGVDLKTSDCEDKIIGKFEYNGDILDKDEKKVSKKSELLTSNSEKEEYDIPEGYWVKKEYIDDTEKEERNSMIEAVKEAFSEYDLPQYQVYAMASFCYNNGKSFLTAEFDDGKGMVNSYKEYYYSNVDNSKYYKYDEWYEDKDNFKNTIQNNTDYVDFELNQFAKKFNAYTNNGDLTNRRKTEWCLFQTGYYGFGMGIAGYGNGINEYWQASSTTGEYGGIDEKLSEIKNGVYATFKSNITGATHSIVNQNESVIGWPRGCCNRGAATIVLSAYTTNLTQLYKDVESVFDKKGTEVFTKYGFTVKKIETDTETDLRKNCKRTIQEALPNAGYVIMYIYSAEKNTSAITKSWKNGEQNQQQIWTRNKHYISVIGYDVIDEKEYIYIADSAWNAEGWYPIEVFDDLENGYIHAMWSIMPKSD